LFYSGTPGSGNDSNYRLVVPTDPPILPTQDGTGGTFNFQDRIAFWFGMDLCDNQSAPEYTHDTCVPNSESNIFDGADPTKPDYIGFHPGTAFLELQFYPPGWVPFEEAIRTSPPSGGRGRGVWRPPALEQQRIAHYRDGTRGHRGPGNDGRQEPERGQRNAKDVEHEREEQVLAALRECRTRKVHRRRDGREIVAQQGHIRRRQRAAGTGAHREGNVGLRERGASLTPSPTIPTIWPCFCSATIASRLSCGDWPARHSSMPRYARPRPPASHGRRSASSRARPLRERADRGGAPGATRRRASANP
jgi:hypothetical protein